MEFSIQWHSGTGRLHYAGGFGAPWSWTCHVSPHSDRPTTAVLEGAETAPPHSAIPVIARALMREGFRHARWRRVKNGADRWVEFDLQKFIAATSA